MSKMPVQGGGQESAENLLASWGLHLDTEMLVLTLTHRSFAHEHGNIPTNERLEFLGDAVLQIVVTEYLYRAYPHLSEGDLAKMRSATVAQTPLASLARDIDLGDYILLGVGEDAGGGRGKDSILSDTYEALIGATYLTHGLEKTRLLLEDKLQKLLRHALERSKEVDWKTTLQELLTSQGRDLPVYEVEGSGPDHARSFKAVLRVGSDIIGTGEGTSKKNAEHEAAKEATEFIRAGLESSRA
ncbi:MAG: ribonuclease III [Actinomycetaceae bacterium]|nr:ribonuclease III [Actinomycetaceae bacterium]